MVDPFMVETLVFIPKILSYVLILFLIGVLWLFFDAFKHGEPLRGLRFFMGGIAFLLWQIFFPAWKSLPAWFQWYLNIGTILMLKAVLSTLLEIPLKACFMGSSCLIYELNDFAKAFKGIILLLYLPLSIILMIVMPLLI
jgi:hypothetical protein